MRSSFLAMSDPDFEPDLTGTVLGRYRLLRRLGAGGMGSVYLAQHELIDRRVALKVLHAALARRPDARKRFLREARAASKVHHPGVVEIHDVAFAGDHVFFVMELLAGRDLAARLVASKRLPWPVAFPIVHQVAQALAAAHAAGVVHRDIKPSNCFLVAEPDGSERVKVVDFGIAKLATEDGAATDRLTATGEVFGTLGYMAPEMAQGAGDDPRSDVYALGVMTFELLTGRLPFEGPALAVVSQHLTKPPPSPRTIDASIPPAVERLVLRALAKHPDDRFPSMRHFIAALEAAAPADAPHLAPAPQPSLAPKPSPPRAPSPSFPAAVSSADVVDLDARPHAPPPPASQAHADEPPPPPMPGEPSRFRPPPDAPLELDLAARSPAPAAPAARRGLVPLLLLAVAVAAVAVAVGLAYAPDDVPRKDPADASEPTPAEAPPQAPAPVLLYVETTPSDARVYVDGVLASERPIVVPRSDRHVRVRVEAEGHEPRTIQVQPRADRRLEVKLDRTAPRRR